MARDRVFRTAEGVVVYPEVKLPVGDTIFDEEGKPWIVEDPDPRDWIVMTMNLNRQGVFDFYGPGTHSECLKAVEQLSDLAPWIIRLEELPLFED